MCDTDDMERTFAVDHVLRLKLGRSCHGGLSVRSGYIRHVAEVVVNVGSSYDKVAEIDDWAA